MITVVIPTYRNPECLDVCLKSIVDNQSQKNEIIVSVDGFIEESQHVLDKYKDSITVLDLQQNQGMQTALNLAVMNATNECILIINDDNVLCRDWDAVIEKHFTGSGKVITVNQVEPRGPGIFNFHVKDFGTRPQDFKYQEFIEYEPTVRSTNVTPDGGIFPFVISKKDYMIVGGFDTMYQSPFICDWDFFLKLDLNNVQFVRINDINFYHFGSYATKNGKEGQMFRATESPAAQVFYYKWGIPPQMFENNSHKPKGLKVKGVQF